MTTIIPERRPEWLRVRPPKGENYENLKNLMRNKELHTVCEEARCPNIGECWGHKTATFMILGRVCTRSCGFCAVETGRPIGLDWEEPKRVAEAVQKMGLRHAVVTSVSSGLVRLTTPPADVRPAGVCSPTQGFVFDELQGVTLGADQKVDYNAPGSYSAYPAGVNRVPPWSFDDAKLVLGIPLIPYRSNASRSNQFAAGQMSTTEAITGNSSSGAYTRTRTRWLWVSESK